MFILITCVYTLTWTAFIYIYIYIYFFIFPLSCASIGSLRHKRATQLFSGAVVAVNYTKVSQFKQLL